MVRYAFTMIELIFALVIMSIVFISLPLVLLNNASSVEDNIIQESIFLTSSKMSQVLTYQWDDASSQAGMATVSASDVVNVTAGDALLDRNVSDFRVGHFQQDKHRRMSPIGGARFATAIGIEGAVFDDIDDFDGLINQNIIAATGVGGYKKSYRADVNVSYINDSNFRNATTYASNSIDFTLDTTPVLAGTTNLKMIEVRIEQNNTTGWDPTLVLRAYVANIGETDYFKRRY